MYRNPFHLPNTNQLVSHGGTPLRNLSAGLPSSPFAGRISNFWGRAPKDLPGDRGTMWVR